MNIEYLKSAHMNIEYLKSAHMNIEYKFESVKKCLAFEEQRKTIAFLLFQGVTLIGDYIDIMKTTFYLNFDLHKAFKHGNTELWKQREAVN